MDSKHFGMNISIEVDTAFINSYRQMILDTAGPEFITEYVDEIPNPNAQKFYDMLNMVDEKL